MIKLYFLLSRKTRRLILTFVALVIISISGYFLFDVVNQKFKIIPEPPKEIFYSNLLSEYEGDIIDNLDENNNLTGYTTKTYELDGLEKNKDITSLICVSKRAENISDLNDLTFKCIIFAKEWNEEKKTRVLVVNFDSVTDYISECFLIDTDNNDDNALNCFSNPGDENNDYNAFIEEKVFSKAKELVEKIYFSLSSGPEMQLLESININRGTTNTTGLEILAKYNNGVIDAYISTNTTEGGINTEVNNSIKATRGLESSYRRDKESILSSIVHEYGHHFLVFNQDRTSKINITHDPTTPNPRREEFLNFLSRIKSSFTDEDKYNDYIRIITLANNGNFRESEFEFTLTFPERDELINLVKKYIYGENNTKGKNISSLITEDVKDAFFTCETAENRIFPFFNDLDYYGYNTETIKGKNNFIEKIRYWFSFDEQIARLYTIFTYKPVPPADNCVDELNLIEHNSLIDYLSYGMFGFDPFVSKESIIDIRNYFFPFLKLIEIKDALEALKIGLVIENENIDFLDADAEPNTDYFFKRGIYTVIGWYYYEKTFDSPWSLQVINEAYAPTTSKFNWSKLFYKNSYLADGNDGIYFENSEWLKAFSASFTLKNIEPLDLESTKRVFIDEENRNQFIDGDFFIKLEKIRVYKGFE